MKRIKFESRAQEALTLSKGMGYTYAETAKIMGLATKNPGSYIRQANLKNIQPKKLTDEEVAAIHKKWGVPTGIEKKPEIEVNGDEEVKETKGGTRGGSKKAVEKEQPKREAKEPEKIKKAAPPKKSSSKTSSKSTAEPDSGEVKKAEAPKKGKKTLEDDFTLGQDVVVSGFWQKKSFTRNGKIMGFLDPGQDLNSLFEKPPSKKNVFRIGDQTKRRLVVVSMIGRIKSFFDPTEDQVKTD